MAHPTLAFIGGGNMARSLVSGLVADGWPQDTLWVADPDPSQLKRLLGHFKAVNTTADNDRAASQADVVLMAVKPQALRSVARALTTTVQAHRPLIVSVAAGIRATDLNRWLGGGLAVVRCMPNTPALVRSGATGLHANLCVSPDQRELVEQILRAVGLTIWVHDEALLDTVTALSGSGPAYFLMVMEAMEQAGVGLGLASEDARRLTLQTALGTARLALAERDDVTTLRARVTSPGGTTERAVAELDQGGLRQLFERALRAAARRARELADEFAEEQA
jgi:pyrroline-5-carboxylate reductase